MVKPLLGVYHDKFKSITLIYSNEVAYFLHFYIYTMVIRGGATRAKASSFLGT